MDNSNSNGPGTPSQQPSSEPGSIPPDHVALRVTYLVTGNPRPPHPLGILPLSTTVATLKNKIQTELPEHPSPPEQRLIYQGRPLLRTEATLRDVLRIEPGTAPGPLPYTIHIVIQATVPPPPPSNIPIYDTTIPAPPPPPPPPPPPAVHHNHHIDHLRAVEASATILQESLSRIQQQIETNRADLLSVQQRINMQHHQPGMPLGDPAMLPAGVPIANVLRQAQAQGTPVAWSQLPAGRTPARPQNGSPSPAPPNQQSSTAGTPSNDSSQPNARAPPATVREFRHPNGDRVTVIRNHMSVPLPLQRPPSAPGQPGPRAPTTPAPQYAAPQHLPSTAARTVQTPFPFAGPPNLPLAFPQNRPFQSHTPTGIPTAWILSSPRGPEGLLFAPGHGMFSTRQRTAGSVTQQTPPGHAPTPSSIPHNHQQQPPAPVNQNGNARGALIRPDQGPAQPPVAQIQQNAENDDLFGFLIHRGWLFLRLYLFMFVFSEPGTWKRWAMILIAAIICLQPREGPFVRAVRVARRHLDNLIGPPAQPQPQPAAARQGAAEDTANAENNRAGQRPANVRGAVQMTPEEAAARLVREHQARNPNFWRDTFYRVEQSIALFLASLVPGIGERHVMAREEARREAQRLEEERRRAEQEAAAQAGADGADNRQPGEGATESGTASGAEVKVDRPDEPSTSTSVQVDDSSAEAGELRNRTT